MVRNEHTRGAPAKSAIGPIATSNGVLAGAAQSYANLRWFRSPLNTTRSERDRCRNRSGASVCRSHCRALRQPARARRSAHARRCTRCTRTGAAHIPICPLSRIAVPAAISARARRRPRTTHLPPPAQAPEALELRPARVREELAVDHRVEEPLPVLARHVRDKPRKALAVEAHLRRKPRLDEVVGCAPTEASAGGNAWATRTHRTRSRSTARIRRCRGQSRCGPL